MFLNNNSSSDAYGFAMSIKYGEELFSPHHLLYNPFYWLLCKPILALFPNADVLSLTKMFNAFFGTMVLYILSRILKMLQLKNNIIFVLIALAGFSYGPWRFSVENESYILPIMLSLAGSAFYLRFLSSGKNMHVFLSGVFAMSAAFFHQTHFFWWLVLLISILWQTKNITKPLFYFLPALAVPLVYAIVAQHLYGSFSIYNTQYFMFHDFHSGSAPTDLGWENLFFICVSIVRTFLQIYPYMLLLIKASILYLFPVLMVVFSLLFTIKFYRKNKFKKPSTTISNNFKHFAYIHLLILFLHLCFAIYLAGNSEFIVMAPAVLAIFFGVMINVEYKPALALAASFFVWNFMFGILPNSIFRFSDIAQKTKFAQQHQDAVFVNFTNQLHNQYQYYYGPNSGKNILIDFRTNQDTVRKMIESGVTVFTDMPKGGTPNLNRGDFMKKNLDTAFWNTFKLTKADSFTTFYGTSYFYKAEKK